MRENNSDSGLGTQSSSSYYESLLCDSEETASDSEGNISDMLREGDIINVLN